MQNSNLFPPVVTGDLVQVGTINGEVIALRPSNGSAVWRRRVTSGFVGAICRHDDGLVVSTSDSILKLDDQGEEVWRRPLEQYYDICSDGEGRIFAVSANRVIALDVNGDQVWAQANESLSTPLTREGLYTPIRFGKFLIHPTVNATLVARDANDGELAVVSDTHWEISPQNASKTPIVIGDMLVVLVEGNAMVAFNKALLNVWAHRSKSWLGFRLGQVGPYLTVKVGSGLGFFDSANGRQVQQIDLWKYPQGRAGVAFDGYVSAGSQIIAVELGETTSSQKSSVVRLLSSTGDVLWQFVYDIKPPESYYFPSLEPVVARGRLFLISQDGLLTAFGSQ